jgi:hypothetical protein
VYNSNFCDSNVAFLMQLQVMDVQTYCLYGIGKFEEVRVLNSAS